MSQGNLFYEAMARDDALALFEEYRRALIDTAFDIAVDIAKKQGNVTSPQVLAVLRNHPTLGNVVRAVDRRFMGAVFRRKCWERIGWTATGSHLRPVAVWVHREEKA